MSNGILQFYSSIRKLIEESDKIYSLDIDSDDTLKIRTENGSKVLVYTTDLYISYFRIKKDDYLSFSMHKNNRIGSKIFELWVDTEEYFYYDKVKEIDSNEFTRYTDMNSSTGEGGATLEIELHPRLFSIFDNITSDTELILSYGKIFGRPEFFESTKVVISIIEILLDKIYKNGRVLYDQ